MIATFEATWSRDPFSTEGITAAIPAGKTLADCAALFGSLPHARFLEVGTAYLNGAPIDRDFWRLVRPKAGTKVVLRLVPGGGGRGGGGAKNVLTTVASLAVVIAAAAVSGGALGPAGLALLGEGFAAGTWGATAAGAAVGLAGGLAVSALAPPPASMQSPDREKGGTASASANVAAPGGPLPRVVGSLRFAPPALTQPLIELRGDDEFVEVVYGLAGPHKIEAIRVGDVDEDRIEDFNVQTREGWNDDEPLSLITRYAHTEAPTVELTGFRTDDEEPQVLIDQSNPSAAAPQWHAFTSRMSCDEIWINFMFPEGIYDTSGDTSVNNFMVLPLRIRIRERGDSTWINLPELHIVNRRSGMVRRCVKIVWDSAPTPTAPPDDRGFRQAFTQVGALSGPNDWEADSHFYGGSGARYVDATNYGATGVQNLILKRHEAIVYLQTGAGFDKAIYDIEIKKGSITRVGSDGSGVGDPAGYVTDGYTGTSAPTLFDYWTDTGVHKAPRTQLGLYQAAHVARISSVRNSPPVNGTGCALIAIKAKNRNVQPVTALFSGYVRDWDDEDEAWTDWKTTKNPAPHFRDVLRGPLNARTLPEARVDNAALLAWRDRCATDGLEISAVLSGMSVDAALGLIAAAGYARPYKSEIWGVIEDKDRSGDAPVQLLSHRNTADHAISKVFPARPHAFIARFRAEAMDYRETFVTVYDEGYNADGSGGNVAASIFEEITYDGLTKQSLVEARAAFDLKQSRLRSRTYRLRAPVEALTCRRGDLVALQSDIVARYVSQGRVVSKEVNTSDQITSLLLDDMIHEKIAGPLFGEDGLDADEPFFGDDPDDPMFPEGDPEEPFFGEDPDDPMFDGDTSLFGLSTPLVVSIRLTDGTILTVEGGPSGADRNRIDFATPFDDPGDTLVAGCLVTSGVVPARRCIIAAAVPADDLTWDLELVDEAPSLWA